MGRCCSGDWSVDAAARTGGRVGKGENEEEGGGGMRDLVDFMMLREDCVWIVLVVTVGLWS